LWLVLTENVISQLALLPLSSASADPLYIAEVTPAQHRGELVTWSEIAINVGLVFGFSTGLFLEWRAMFLFGGILPLVMIVLALTVMPESPRWLIANNRVHEAKCVLQQTYPPGYDVDVIVAGIEAQEREREAEHSIGWGAILHPTPAFRRMLFVGIGTAVSQQFVGIDAIQYYLIDVIAQSGIDTREKQSLVLIFLGLLKLVFVVIGGKLFDRDGRRPLLFTSLLGMAVALLMVSFSFLGSSKLSTGFTMFGLSLYLAFFSIGMGPGAWLLPSEVFANCIRGKAMSIAAFLNRVAATIMASTFLSTAEAIGWSGFFLLLAIASVTVFGVMYVYLPETKGRSIEDMSRYFAEITNDTSVLEAEARIRRRQEYASDKEEMEMTETQERSSAASPCLVT
jgi:MFS family permease